MCDDAHPFHPKKRRSAVFSVVEALLEVDEGAAREQRSHLAGDGGLQRFFQRRADQIGHAFGNLQRDVSHEAVGDDHVDMPVVQVAAFHVPDKIQGKLFEQLKRFAGEFVPLGFFFADREQSDARACRPDRLPNVVPNVLPSVFPNMARK